MFGISFSELALIAIVAVIVFGPEQLPIIAQKLGALVAKFRNTRQSVTEQIYHQFGVNEFNQIKEELTQTVNELRHPITSNYEYNESITQEQFIEFLYQPELDFEHQPELFDE